MNLQGKFVVCTNIWGMQSKNRLVILRKQGVHVQVNANIFKTSKRRQYVRGVGCTSTRKTEWVRPCRYLNLQTPQAETKRIGSRTWIPKKLVHLFLWKCQFVNNSKHCCYTNPETCLLTLIEERKLTMVQRSQIMKAPIVASSWLSWMSMLITWHGSRSLFSRFSRSE